MIVPAAMYSQKNRSDYIDTKELNDHLINVFEDKKIFKQLIGLDHNGDSAIFVITDLCTQFYQTKPINNGEYKTYFWNTEDIFFYQIYESQLMRIVSYDSNVMKDVIELLVSGKRTYFVRIILKHSYSNQQRVIPSEIESIQIGKIKWK